MSTRCLICKELPYGKVRGIFCHHDGSLRVVGRPLLDCYADGNDGKSRPHVMKSLLIWLLLFVATSQAHARWIDMVVSYDDDVFDIGGYTNGTEIVDGRRWSYQVRGDSIAVRRVNPASGAVAVPPVIAGKQVTVIGASAFSYCTAMTSISIPQSVTNIERYAFSGCSGLGSGVIIVDRCVLCVNGTCPNAVVLPEDVRLIASGAFSGIRNITSISLSASVKNIGDQAFLGCTGIKEYCVSSDNVSYKLANGMLVSEDGKTLVGVINAASINVPYGVERIPDRMFEYYSLVESVEIPSTVKSIGRDAFYGCSRMVSVAIPEGVEKIPDSAFSGCYRLENVRIPSTVKTIGRCAFYQCSNMKELEIPEGVLQLSDAAFSHCQGLTAINIPSSVARIGDGVFSGCAGVEGFSVAQGNKWYKSEDGMLCSYDGHELLAGLNRTMVFIPRGVENIRYGAFKGCYDLESVSVPPSVTNIDEYAFCECSRLAQINIPDSITHIGGYAFDDCWSLGDGLVVVDGWALGCNDEYASNIEIPEGVRHMVDGLFSSMSTLESARLPSSLEEISDGTFCFCDNLSQIDIPQGIGRIGDAAFWDCGKILSVTIPSSVTNIGCYAFDSCCGLSSIVVPGGVVSIGGWAFSSCRGLLSVIVSDGVVSIGEYAFSSCDNLLSVSLPASAINIGDNILNGCYCLQDVTLPGWDCGIKNASFTRLAISEGTREIAAKAFIFNESLQSVRIPSSVMRIGSQAFYGCSGLGLGIVIADGCVICVNGSCPSVVELSADVRVIGAGLFTGRGNVKQYVVDPDNPYLRTIDGMICTKDGRTLLVGVNKKGVTIPASVTNIAERAFEACRDLVGIRIPTNVVELGEFAFCESGLLTVEIDNGISVLRAGVLSVVDLVSVSIPKSVVEIDDFAFGYLSEGVLQRVYVDAGDAGRVGALYKWPVGRPGWPFEIVERVRGNCPVAVPMDWMNLYDGFELEFGSDLESALMKPTGKFDRSGNAMLVWQDYVAGTDPTDPNDKFVVSITLVDGNPVVSWTPELSPGQSALRKYTVYGKAKLQDSEWAVVEGDESLYNFFKVAVEMR